MADLKVKFLGVEFKNPLVAASAEPTANYENMERVIEAGTGEAPAATDTVRVHYVGTFRDGTVFDSSRAADKPADFPLERVAPCFSEGLKQMKVGGKSKLVCPSDLAYGDRGIPGRIPGGAVLVFEVEFLEIP